MASRRLGPYEGRAIQAPGMMRHGPFPREVPATHRRPVEPLPPPELLENKVASQAAEIERLVRENQKLVATDAAMREEIDANQKEIQRIKAHIGSVRTESEIQIRGLLEKIRKWQDDIRAGEVVEKELPLAHKEAKGLIAHMHQLTGESQRLKEELQRAGADGKKLPEMIAELDGLRQEHQKLRVAFEREKSSNVEQVEQMRGMERNLMSLAREIEKLRADMINCEKGDRIVNPYASTFSSPSLYPSAGQGIGYGHVPGGAGYSHQAYLPQSAQFTSGALSGNGATFADGYARYPTRMSSGAAGASEAGYSDGYGRSQVPLAGGSGVNSADAARGGSIP